MSACRAEEASACDGAEVQSSAQPMKVADVRRALSIIRKSWEDQHLNNKSRPFYLTNPIQEGLPSQSAEKFSLSFVLLHHTRRLPKSQSG